MVEVVVEPGLNDFEVKQMMLELLIKYGPLTGKDLWRLIRKQDIIIGEDRVRRLLREMEHEKIVYMLPGKNGKRLWDSVEECFCRDNGCYCRDAEDEE